MKEIWLLVVLLLLAIGEICSLYWALFFLWMTAYRTTNLDMWRMRAYLWIALSVLLGFIFIGILVWRFRLRRKASA